MAFDLLRSAKHIRGLSNAEFRVLFYLLEAANNATHECYPSMKKIAAFTDMGERTVQRHVSALADRGLFERVEQRRADGSRAVNCYRFVVAGEIRVGKESVVQLGPETQPANYGGLVDQQPAIPDTTPRQEWRDIDQESEPGITPLSSNEDSPPQEKDLFGQALKTPEQIQAEFEDGFIRWIEEEWQKLTVETPAISGLRTISPERRKAIIARAELDNCPVGQMNNWAVVFEQIRNSRFLRGLAKPGRDRDEPNVITFDWLLKPRNFVKVLEGNYRDKRTLAPGHDGISGRKLTAVEEAGRNVAARLQQSGERRGFGSHRGGTDARAPALVDGRANRD